MSLLVITTLTHLLVIPFSPSPYYSALITASTTVSALWHYTEASGLSNLSVFNQLLAMIWFIADMGFPIDDKVYVEIMILNMGCALLNPMLRQFDYVAGHSFWHLLSALKCIYVANLLAPQSPNNLL